MKKRVTIKDIAIQCGLSVNCISRALMDAPDISEKTKQRVRDISAEMGYIPNRAATTLRKGSSKTVGILYDNLLNPFYSIMTNYLWAELSKYGYSFVTLINDNPFFGPNVAKRALSNNVDGVISFLEPDEETLELLENHNLPLVVVGRKTSLRAETVLLDDEGGGRAAAEFLYNKGYRKPVYLGETTALACSKDRAEGFVEQFATHGVEAKELFNMQCDANAYRKFVSGILTWEQKPDCLFLFNDFFALEVLTLLREHGANMAVVGFDDIQNEIAMNGRISSVGYSKERFASLAVDKLMAQIGGNGGNVATTVLDDIFIVDGETA